MPSLYLDGRNKYVHNKSSPNIDFIRRQDQNNYFDTETRSNLDIFNATTKGELYEKVKTHEGSENPEDFFTILPTNQKILTQNNV